MQLQSEMLKLREQHRSTTCKGCRLNGYNFPTEQNHLPPTWYCFTLDKIRDNSCPDFDPPFPPHASDAMLDPTILPAQWLWAIMKVGIPSGHGIYGKGKRVLVAKDFHGRWLLYSGSSRALPVLIPLRKIKELVQLEVKDGKAVVASNSGSINQALRQAMRLHVPRAK